MAWNYGYFHGLKKMLDEYDVTDKQAMKIKVMLYKHILTKITESKREITYLQNAVMRMESACHAGTIPNLQTARHARDNNLSSLEQALQAFDGWTISLLETNVSLLWAIHNPETAGIRIDGLKNSFTKLYDLRKPEIQPFNNFPEVFDLDVHFG
jgi:hypothetical protein